MAKLVKVGPRWHFLTTYQERHLVPRNPESSKALMAWNHRDAPKVWSTDRARVAALIAEFADGETRRDIKALADKEADLGVASLLFDGATYRYYSPYGMSTAARDAGFEFTRDPRPAHWHTQDPDRAVRCYQVAMHYEGFTCPSAIQMVLQAHLEAQQGAIEASRVVGLDVDLTRPEGLDYFPYQKAAIVYAMQRRNVLFADSMGLGKSIETLGLVNALHLHSVLIIAPATIKLNWARECEKWLMDGQRVGIADAKQVPFAADVVIVNYESLGKRPVSTECLGCKHDKAAHAGVGIFPCRGQGEGMRCGCVQFVPTPPGDHVLRPELDREWDLLVADECFPRDTPVLTCIGWRTIGEIVDHALDVPVASVNLETNQLEWRRIVRWISTPKPQFLVKINHENGAFTCTANHKIWTERGYVQAANLLQGDCLRMVFSRQTQDGNFSCSRVVSVEVQKQRGLGRHESVCPGGPFVYNLEVEGNHNYFAAGILVSNCHRLKSGVKSIRGRLTLSIRAKRMAFLSGSPLPNKTRELWPILHHLAPEVFSSEWKFYREFSGATRANSWNKDGASNLDLLQDKMRASCFPYSVLVECDRGLLPIGEIVESQLPVYVRTYNHLSACLDWRRIVAFSKRPAPDRLVRVKHEIGQFDCTAGHPVWDGKAYVRAESLVPGVSLSVLPEEKESCGTRWSDKRQILFGKMRGKTSRVFGHQSPKGDASQNSKAGGLDGKNMRVVQGSVLSLLTFRGQQGVGSSSFLRSVLSVEVATDAAFRFGRFRQHAKTGGDKTTWSQASRNFRAIQGCPSLDGKKEAAQRGSEETVGSPKGSGARSSVSSAVAATIGASDGVIVSRRMGGSDDSLPASSGSVSQGRDLFPLRGFDSSVIDDRYRDRRQNPSLQEATTNRSVEGKGLAFSRVLSVEVLEQRGGCGHRGGRGEDSSVYDIEVEGDHNYFANGALVHNCMIRRTLEEVWPEMPPKRRMVIEFPAAGLSRFISAEQDAWARREALRLELRTQVELTKASDDPEDHKRAVAALKEGMKVAFSEIAKLRHDTAVAKLPLAIQHIENALESCDKFVAFAHHHDVILPLVEHFGKQAVAVYGTVKDSERMALVDRFNSDPSCRLFIGGIFVAGVGISLRAAHLSFLEGDWVPANMNQCEDRCRGVGRGIEGVSLLIQHLVLEGSLDAQMMRTLIAKQEIADKALDRRSEEPEPLDAAFEYEPEAVVLGEKREAVAPEEVADLPSTHGATPEWIVKTAAKLGRDDILLIHLSLRKLAGLCDGAASRDGVGFGRFDIKIGHSLAAMELRDLTQKQAALGLRLLKKYNQSQLGGVLDSLYEREA